MVQPMPLDHTSHNCPLCGSALQLADRLAVDLTFNTAIFNGQTIKLTGQQAEILSVIADKHPNPAKTQLIHQRVEGQQDGLSQQQVRVQIHYIRKRLAPLGITISAAGHRGSIGYQIKPLVLSAGV